jgi:hypothetical protein
LVKSAAPNAKELRPRVCNLKIDLSIVVKDREHTSVRYPCNAAQPEVAVIDYCARLHLWKGSRAFRLLDQLRFDIGRRDSRRGLKDAAEDLDEGAISENNFRKRTSTSANQSVTLASVVYKLSAMQRQRYSHFDVVQSNLLRDAADQYLGRSASGRPHR